MHTQIAKQVFRWPQRFQKLPASLLLCIRAASLLVAHAAYPGLGNHSPQTVGTHGRQRNRASPNQESTSPNSRCALCRFGWSDGIRPRGEVNRMNQMKKTGRMGCMQASLGGTGTGHARVLPPLTVLSCCATSLRLLAGAPQNKTKQACFACPCRTACARARAGSKPQQTDGPVPGTVRHDQLCRHHDQPASALGLFCCGKAPVLLIADSEDDSS